MSNKKVTIHIGGKELSAVLNSIISDFAFTDKYAFANGALTDFGSGGVNNGYGIFSIIILAPWAFVGFESVSNSASGFKFDSKRVIRILTTSLSLFPLPFDNLLFAY